MDLVTQDTITFRPPRPGRDADAMFADDRAVIGIVSPDTKSALGVGVGEPLFSDPNGFSSRYRLKKDDRVGDRLPFTHHNPRHRSGREFGLLTTEEGR
jgi:hypothetical protein